MVSEGGGGGNRPCPSCLDPPSRGTTWMEARASGPFSWRRAGGHLHRSLRRRCQPARSGEERCWLSCILVPGQCCWPLGFSSPVLLPATRWLLAFSSPARVAASNSLASWILVPSHSVAASNLLPFLHSRPQWPVGQPVPAVLGCVSRSLRDVATRRRDSVLRRRTSAHLRGPAGGATVSRPEPPPSGRGPAVGSSMPRSVDEMDSVCI